jgi:membrane protein implicated in regulation of membrane protease activity
MAIEGYSVGWIIILFGAIFFLTEVFSPGFFLLVPGTVLIVIGVLMLLGVDIFSSGYGIIIGIVVALVAAVVTIKAYSRLTLADEKPFTTSMDSLIGKEGVLLKSADTETLDGKANIEGQIWSAKTETGLLSEGTRIRVVSSKGVHIVVEEVH